MFLNNWQTKSCKNWSVLIPYYGDLSLEIWQALEADTMNDSPTKKAMKHTLLGVWVQFFWDSFNSFLGLRLCQIGLMNHLIFHFRNDHDSFKSCAPQSLMAMLAGHGSRISTGRKHGQACATMIHGDSMCPILQLVATTSTSYYQ